MNYSKLLHQAVSKKWPTAELKEWWYTKHSAVRRAKTTKLFERQGGKCFYCDRETWLTEQTRNGMPPRRQATLEHVVPQCEGGTDNLNNLVMACGGCNRMRGDMNFEKFRELRQDPEKWSEYCIEVRRIRDRQRNTRSKARTEKRESRQHRVIISLALLFMYFPVYSVYSKKILEDNERRRRERSQRILQNKYDHMIDPSDILVDTLSPLATMKS